MKDNCTMNFKKDEYLTLGNASGSDTLLDNDSLLNSNHKQKTYLNYAYGLNCSNKNDESLNNNDRETNADSKINSKNKSDKCQLLNNDITHNISQWTFDMDLRTEESEYEKLNLNLNEQIDDSPKINLNHNNNLNYNSG